ncbi:MAG: SPOR domain-containing protein, partial [Candidatus Krumholzibacteriia bacterium]
PPELSVAAALEALVEQEPAAESPEADPQEYARRRGSSGVFWLVAAAATVLIALVGFYYVKFVRVTDGDLFAGAPTAAVQRPAPPPAAVPDTGGTGSQVAMVPAGVGADTAVAAADTAAAQTQPTPTEAEPEPAPERATAEPPVAAQPTPAAGEDAAPAFDPAPYEEPVGAAGWALQVYSFRDSASAGQEMATLGRRGLGSAVRVVELPGSGRWWRIYVGSFPSRQAARAAMPALFGKLGIDWAQPSRFSVAATDTAGR